MAIKDQARFTQTSKCRTCGNSVMGDGYCMACSRKIAQEKLKKDAEAAAALEHARTHLAIADLTIDPEMQMREKIHQDIVAQYAEAMERGDKFPPLSVVRDGKTNWLVDGWHRREAMLKLGWTEARCEYVEGRRRDALIAAACANNRHGLRRTYAEMRRAVEALLRDSEWVAWSDRIVSKKAGVCSNVVKRIRRALEDSGAIAPQLIRKHSAIGQRKVDSAEIWSCRETGMSCREIASAHGVSLALVHLRISQHRKMLANGELPVVTEAASTDIRGCSAGGRKNTPEQDAAAAIRAWRRFGRRTDADIVKIVECLVEIVGEFAVGAAGEEE